MRSAYFRSRGSGLLDGFDVGVGKEGRVGRRRRKGKVLGFIRSERWDEGRMFVGYVYYKRRKKKRRIFDSSFFFPFLDDDSST